MKKDINERLKKEKILYIVFKVIFYVFIALIVIAILGRIYTSLDATNKLNKYLEEVGSLSTTEKKQYKADVAATKKLIFNIMLYVSIVGSVVFYFIKNKQEKKELNFEYEIKDSKDIRDVRYD